MRPLQTFALKLLLLLLPFLSFSLELSKEQLKAIAQRELKRIQPDGVVLGITLYSDKIQLPNTPLEFFVEKNFTNFYLKIANPITGKVYLQIPLRVAFNKKVPVAVKDIKPGQRIDRTNVRFEKKLIRPFEVGQISPNPYGKISKTYIRKGEIILKRYIGKPLIPAGKRVVIEFVKDNLLIKTYGTLLDNGQVGEQVRVKRGKKIFTGSLKDENTVVVYLP